MARRRVTYTLYLIAMAMQHGSLSAADIALLTTIFVAVEALYDLVYLWLHWSIIPRFS